MPALQTIPSRLAFVDLETTGGTAGNDRITEVGIIEVDEDGVREWSSLVNPQMPIPPFIQSLTGISNEMVENAPTFAELADQIHARLSDRVFIAHNARFDHGFLKSEFSRTGHDFGPPVLCTVRLSRKLFPDFARHNLDSIVERHRLHVTERHRALGDAQLIWQFWQSIRQTHAPDLVDETVARLVSRPGSPSLPKRLESLRIESLPSSHGVYVFYDKNDAPLHIGKAVNLKKSVLQHLGGEVSSFKQWKDSREVARVEWTETSGEIGSLLKEAALTRQLLPAEAGKSSRAGEEACSWRLLARKGMLQPVLATTDDLFFGHDKQLYGLFAGKRRAHEALKAVVDAHQLCYGMLGMEKLVKGKPCFGTQVKKCLGACAGQESIDEHNARVLEAFKSLHLQAWPYVGAIGVQENGQIHVIGDWAHLGTASSIDEAKGLLQNGKQRFDQDVYQILQKRLSKIANRIVELEK